jgi:glycine/D-amino acid oxidase-like deaminating enzyme
MRTILSSSDAALTTGTPFWPERANMPGPVASLQQDVSCEVVLVGGGISGALIGYSLAKAGIGSVMIDKGRFGAGSTSASTALVSYEFDVTLSELSERLGSKAAIRTFELSYQSTQQIRTLVEELEDPCDYDEKVAIRISNHSKDRDALCREAEMRNRHGFPVKFLHRAELKSRFGLDAQMGLVSENAAQIDPLKLTRRLIDRGRSLGMRTYERTRATKIESGKEGVRLSTANGPVIHAKHAIFATGYESEKYLGGTGSKLTTDFCFITHPCHRLGNLAKCHIVENRDDYLYLSTFGDQIMVGLEGPTFYYPAARARRISLKVREIKERLSEYLPSLEIEPEHSWASTFANSRNSLPYIATPSSHPRTYFALAYGGNGIASSGILASILVDLICTGKNPDAKLFRLER